MRSTSATVPAYDWQAGMSFDMSLDGAPTRALDALGQGAKRVADAPASAVKAGIKTVEKIADKAAEKGGAPLRAPESARDKAVSYSSLYGLFMQAAKASSGPVAGLLAETAGLIRASASAAGRKLAAKADAFTKPALESLRQASDKAGGAIASAAKKMGDSGAAALDAYRAILATIPDAMKGYAKSMGIVVGGAVVLLALGGGVYLASTTSKR